MRNHLKEVEDKKAGWSSYCKYTKTDRDAIGKYTANHGIANAVRKCKQRFPAIKQHSVSDFKRRYIELKSTNSSEAVTEIQAKKRGRPFLLPDEPMTKTVGIIEALRLKAAPISYSVMAAVARGAILSHDKNLLLENGGHLSFSDGWIRHIIYKVTKDEKIG